MLRDLVTVHGFEFLHQAEAARIYLENEGIQAFLADAETVNMDWGLGNAVGYIKLQVPTDQFEAATAALERFRPSGSEAETCLACGADIPPRSIRCPACSWSYVDDEGQPEDARDEEPTDEPGGMSTTERLKSLKRPVFLVLLTPFFAGMLLLALLIIVGIVSIIVRQLL